MNKDVIYIDVEDDITAIISKVKASKEKIVALVPPKRIGVLQSAVNLRLLARAADQGEKHLVIITNNHALSSLAASAKLPVAKNLQSKPELAPIAALEVDDEDDIIDGNDLPVGDHAKLATDDEASMDVSESVIAGLAEPPKDGEPTKPAKVKNKKAKVPDFNTFRKKLIFAGIGGALLLVFLVWAIFFAPHATIIVSAKTTDKSVNAKATANDAVTTDASKETIKAVKVSKTEDKKVNFQATGSKNVGEKASGTVSMSYQSQTGTTVPAGTRLSTSGGLVFVTDEAAVIPASTVGGGCFPTACPGSTTVSVSAAEGGAKYNAATGSLSGAPSGVTARLTGPTSGGTDKIAKVVTDADVQKAKESMVDGESATKEDELKTSLKGAKYIEGSYKVSYAEVTSTPGVNEEAASGTAVLSAKVTYSLYGITSSELGKFLDQYLKKELGNDNKQYVYDNGKDDAEFQDITNTDTGATLTIVATAKVGPKLNEDEIRNQSLGKKGGEIQESLQTIPGVENVDVSYFPFWVNSVPDNPDKVTVQFKVNGEK